MNENGNLMSVTIEVEVNEWSLSMINEQLGFPVDHYHKSHKLFCGTINILFICLVSIYLLYNIVLKISK